MDGFGSAGWIGRGACALAALALAAAVAFPAGGVWGWLVLAPCWALFYAGARVAWAMATD